MSNDAQDNRSSANPEDLGIRAIRELKDGFVTLQQQNESRMDAQERKLAELYQGLQGVFNKLYQDTHRRDTQTRTDFDALSTTIIRSSEELRKEYEEMERLQEKRMEAESQEYSHGLRRTKIIAVPAVILAFLALIYMFYTVSVMERAMTQMSEDIKGMRKDMTQLTHNVGGMRQDMSHLTRNVSANMGGMRRDMSVMTHNVAPAMQGMRSMMPWSP